MGLFVESYSFADFAKHWANELGRDPNEVATVVAKAILQKELVYHTHDPLDPGPSHHQEIPYSENLNFQEFDAALLDHLHLVAKGIDSPDSEKRLRYVTLDRSDVAKWLASVDEELPLFWQDLVTDQMNRGTPLNPATAQPGPTEHRTLQKIIAVLTLTLADEHKKFRHNDAINRLQVFEAMKLRLDDDPQFTKRLRGGLARSTVDEHIRKALAVFDKDADQD